MVEIEWIKRRKICKKFWIKPRKVKSEIRKEKCESTENGPKPTTTSHKVDEMLQKTGNADAVSQFSLNTSLVVTKLEVENFSVYRYDLDRLAKYYPFVPADQLLAVYKGKLKDLLDYMYSDSGNGSFPAREKEASN